jgi:rhodanese-related sulfurtransferase
MLKIIRDAILLSILAAAIALGVNAISPNGIPLKGVWYDNRGKAEMAIPPSYDQKLDSLLTMDDAFNFWKNKQAIFLDTREPEDYANGHIPGAINFPFEKWDEFWAGVKSQLSTSGKIVCYCGGLDCELSLDAARELKTLGYPNAYIFFGGIKKWQDFKLPVEKSNAK